jgi:ADP-ribose pyrophosphatase
LNDEKARERDSHLIETVISSQPVFDGKLLHIREDSVRLPNGAVATREYVVHPGAALVVPVLADERLVALRQYRHPVGEVFVEFPAGKLDPGETGIDTARRELVEEAGYEARTWAALGRIHSVVGYSNEVIDLYLARDLTHVGATPDDGEFLEVVPMSLGEMLALLDRGALTDAKTVAALLLYARRADALR